MDCYYHNAVPSVSRCQGCGKSICATCRDEQGECPGCRLAARVDAAAAQAKPIGGSVGPSRGAAPGWSSPKRQPRATPAVTVPSVESRALVALGYPFWPLALLALFDAGGSRYLKRQAVQALAFNFGMYALWTMLSFIANIPVLGWSAWPLLPLMIPVALVASVVYGFKAWHGDEVRIPLISDWLDRTMPA